MPLRSALAHDSPHPKGGFPRARRSRGSCVASALVEPRDQEHLDRARDRDRGERTEHAGQLGADQDGDEDRQRRKLHGPAVDDRLDDVVLDLLVDDEEDDQDDPGGHRVDEPDR